MKFTALSACPTSLDEIIDRSFLTVAPDASLVEVLASIGQIEHSYCDLGKASDRSRPYCQSERSSCVFVTETGQATGKLMGMFTGRDGVRLAATGENLVGIAVGEVMTQPAIAISETEYRDIFTLLALFHYHQIDHLPVLNSQNQLVGLITPDRVCQTLHASPLFRLHALAEVMCTTIIQAPPTASLMDLARLMVLHHVNYVAIPLETNQEKPLTPDAWHLAPTGIITAQGIIQLQALELDIMSCLQAQTIAIAPALSLMPTDSLWKAYYQMQQLHVRHLTVKGTQGELLGIVTPTNLLQVLHPANLHGAIETLQQKIDRLEAEKSALLQRRPPWVEPPVEETHGTQKLQGGQIPSFAPIPQRIEAALQNMALGIASASGEAFFQTLVQALAKTLAVDYALVGELVDCNREYIRTVAVCANGQIVENFDYALACTPCENIITNGVCIYPNQVQRQFPQDPLLANMAVESYLGIPLVSATGDILGLISVMAYQPLSDPQFMQEILQIFAVRAASELERRQAEAALQQSEQKLRAILDNSTTVIYLKDAKGRYLLANRDYQKLVGLSETEIIGKIDSDLFPQDVATAFWKNDRAVLAAGTPLVFEEIAPHPNGTRTYISIKFPLYDSNSIPYAVGGVSTNITARKRAESLLLGQKQILEMLATGASLQAVLSHLCHFIEAHAEGFLCSILLVDRDSRTLRCGAAPSLPDEFNRAVDGAPIGLDLGPCAAAAFLEQPIIVADLENPAASIDCTGIAWMPSDEFLTLALSYDFRACWSTPIFSSEGQVLGTFALYSHQVLQPTTQEEELIALATQSAGIAIARKQAEAALQQLNESLEVKVHERTAALQENQIRLKLYNHILTDITAGLSVGAVACSAVRQLRGSFQRLHVVYATIDPQSRLTVLHEAKPTAMTSLQGIAIDLTAAPIYLDALRSNQRVAIADISQDDGLQAVSDLILASGMHALFAVPLHHADRLVGLLGFAAPERHVWSEHEMTALQEVAGYLKIAIQEEDAQQKRQQAELALRESEERFRQLAENISEVFYIATPDLSQMLYISPAYEEIWGRSCASLYEQPASWIEDIHPDDRDRVLAALTKKMQGELFREEFRIVRQDGSTRWIFSRSFPIYNEAGQLLRYAGLAEDISDRKQAEAALKQAKEAAEAANLAKSQFLANMSHELRTPLNAILGFAQLLSRDGSLSPKHQESMETIHRSGQHLLALINDILTMSRIDAGRARANPSSFDLSHLLDTIEEIVQLRAESKSLKLVFERDPEIPQYIQTDKSKLRQILINLLDNAIKFTAAGTVKLRVKRVERSLLLAHGKKQTMNHEQLTLNLLFEVEDTGPGIAPIALEHLFDPFIQASTSQKSQSGTGLGLAISQKLAQLLGGEINVRSSLGQGTTFRVNLSVCLARTADVQPQQRLRRAIGLVPNQPTYRILVVEDDRASRKLLAKLLESLGFEVQEAENGQIAVDLWDIWSPHLIWMDIRMPVMDGYEATRKIKTRGAMLGAGGRGQKAGGRGQRVKSQNRKQGTLDIHALPFIAHSAKQALDSGSHTSPLPKIVALTAGSFEQDRAEALAVGCDDFVRKPFQKEIVVEKLVQHLGVEFLYENEHQTTTGGNQQTDKHNFPSTLRKMKCPTYLDPHAPQASLATMPGEWVNQLYQAARQLDGNLILQLSKQNPGENDVLAQKLADLVHDFRFDIIMDMTRPKTK